MDFHIVIPARFASKRFPGKLLATVLGKPLLQHVYECASKVGAKSVTIATDDERIAKVANSFSAKVCLTATTHRNGTERIFEVAEENNFASDDIIVNWQADELFIPKDFIIKLVTSLKQQQVATLALPIDDIKDLMDSNVVKVIFNKFNKALLFTRACVPCNRSGITDEADLVLTNYYRHLGLYAYTVAMLGKYFNSPPVFMEQQERLEQLRFLWNGIDIIVNQVTGDLPPGVDTKADLATVEQFLI